MTYHLRDARNLRRELDDARRSEADEQAADVKFPEPPAIDLLLTIRNVSGKFVRMWNHRGDDRGTLTISLRGAGAVTVSPKRTRLLYSRMSPPLVLAPGETKVVRLHRLVSGFRGDGVHAYWTAPGQYEVSVEWRTAVAPARNTKPPYASDDGEVWRPTTLTSNAVTIGVKSP